MLTCTATTTTATATSTEAHADEEEDAYLAQRQSTMDSATLNKLLKAEKHLTQAGQATSNVWKLIGMKVPIDENEVPAAAAAAAAIAPAPVHNVASSPGRHVRSSVRRKLSTQLSDDISSGSFLCTGGPTSPLHGGGTTTHRATNTAILRDVASEFCDMWTSPTPRSTSSETRSTSPHCYPPVDLGGRADTSASNTRNSLGCPPVCSSTTTQSNSLYERPHFGLSSSARAVDAHGTSDSFNVLVENGRSRSTHSSSTTSSSTTNNPTPSNSNNNPTPSNNVFGFTRSTTVPLSDVTLFTFTVKKSDSVLEKLGSKRASIQLQVDVDERMLYFLSAHDQREDRGSACSSRSRRAMRA
uniref:Uncharacterized protein n=1 Tax=Hyaloperonospora arabidopsidis (strain Emoy2) TaxID=559515 RepID=M4BGD5_HYAAE